MPLFTASGVSAATATFSTDKVSPFARPVVHRRRRQGIHGHERPLHRHRRLRHAGRPAELNGPPSIDARTSTARPTASAMSTGSFHVRNDRPAEAQRPFQATLKGTQLVGFLDASSRGPHVRVLGNLSATFAPTTGFTAGAIGSTSSTAVLAVIAGPTCPKAEARPRPAPKRPVHVEGTISAIGDGRRQHGHGHLEGPVDRDLHARRHLSVDNRLQNRGSGRDGLRLHRHHLDAPRAEEAPLEGQTSACCRERAPTGALLRFTVLL